MKLPEFSPAQKQSLADLALHYDANNIWWQRVKEMTHALVARYGRHLVVSHTDLGGNLDILASFRGTQELLFDLVDCPQEVDRLTCAITQLWLRYYDELHEIMLPAGRGTSSWAPLAFSHPCAYQKAGDFSVGSQSGPL